jgi:hypothetical protein
MKSLIRDARLKPVMGWLMEAERVHISRKVGIMSWLAPDGIPMACVVIEGR